MSKELKRCPNPWCGEKGEVTVYEVERHPNEVSTRYIVCCTKCGIHPPGRADRDEAIQLWNEGRPAQSCNQELIDMILDLHNRLNEMSIARLGDAVEDLKKAAEKWKDEEVTPDYPGKHEGDLVAQIIDLYDVAVRKGKTEDIHDAVDAFVSFALGNKHKRLPEYTGGTTLIAIERSRQITSEKWTLEHDDKHDKGELAEAALYYLSRQVGYYAGFEGVTPEWPWDAEIPKLDNKSDIRMLQIAGALIAAEIDRRIRKGETL